MPSLFAVRPDLVRFRRAGFVAFCVALFMIMDICVAPIVHAELTAIKRGLRVEYPIPGRPLHVAVEEAGRIWFTTPEEDAIGLLIVTSPPDAQGVRYTVDYIVLSVGSQPHDLIYADNTVWFTQRGANKLARIDVATGIITEYDVPTPDSAPTGIAVAPNGTVWFTEQAVGKLGRFDPITETFTEYRLPTTQLQPDELNPQDVAMSNDNVVWLTVPAGNTVMAFNVIPAEFKTIKFDNILTPNKLVMDSKNLPWITSFGSSAIGKYNPGTLSLFDWIATPVENSGPADIVFLNNENVWEFWYAQYSRGYVGRLLVQPGTGTSYQTKEYYLGADTKPWGMALDSNNHIWVAEHGRNVLSELQPPYSLDIHIPSIRR